MFTVTGADKWGNTRHWRALVGMSLFPTDELQPFLKQVSLPAAVKNCK